MAHFLASGQRFSRGETQRRKGVFCGETPETRTKKKTKKNKEKKNKKKETNNPAVQVFRKSSQQGHLKGLPRKGFRLVPGTGRKNSALYKEKPDGRKTFGKDAPGLSKKGEAKT